MAERISTWDPHIETETLQVHLYMLQVLNFVGSYDYLNQHLPYYWIWCMTTED